MEMALSERKVVSSESWVEMGLHDTPVGWVPCNFGGNYYFFWRKGEDGG